MMRNFSLAVLIVLSGTSLSQVLPRPQAREVPFHPERWHAKKPDPTLTQITFGLNERLMALRGGFGKVGEGSSRLNAAIKAFRARKTEAGMARVLAARVEAYFSDASFDKQVPLPEDVIDSLVAYAKGDSEQLAFLTYAAIGSFVVSPRHTMFLDGARESLLKKAPTSMLEKVVRLQRLQDKVVAARVESGKVILKELQLDLGDCFLTRLASTWVAGVEVDLSPKSKDRVKAMITAIERVKAIAPTERMTAINNSLKIWRSYLKNL